MIQVFIADDHAIVRHGLKQLLALAPDIAVAGEAGNGETLLAELVRVPCDLILLDMNMPGLSGVPLIERLGVAFPQLAILVLSMHIDGQVARRALKAGAAGYLTKDSEPEVLMGAIRKVAGGGKYIDPAMVETLVFDREAKGSPPHEGLSDREFQVFRKLVSGRTVSEIAEELCLSIKTVSTHKFRLMRKMNLQTHTDLVRYAIRHQLIDG